MVLIVITKSLNVSVTKIYADRQPEFTQIDVETSFMSDDDIMDLMEGLTVKMFNELLNVKFDKFERMPIRRNA